MDVILIFGLQNSPVTHRMLMLKGACKKETLPKEQRYINNFNKIFHSHEKQKPKSPS